MRRVAVVGAGAAGAGWAALFLAQGLDVHIVDPGLTRERVAARIEAHWPALNQLGLAPGADPARWRWFSDPAAACDGVDFVQESVPDRYEAKIDLIRRLDSALPREVVIASSSAGLLCSKLQERCNYPDRCVLGHPISPVHLVPLVEVVGGFKTGQRAIAEACAFYRQIGKRPIELRKEVPGLVANRLQAALWREAIHLIAEGVATAAEIDAAVADGPALGWALTGPALALALAGGDGFVGQAIRTEAASLAALWTGLGQPAWGPGLADLLTRQITSETAGEAPDRLAADRDAALVRLLTLRRAMRTET